MTDPTAPSRSRLDPGWLFLLPGIAALAAAALLPIQDGLAEVRHQAQRVEAVAQHTQERLDRHRKYLEALEAGNPTLARSLAMSQLNLAPPDRRPLSPGEGLPSASIFEELEPPPPEVPPREVRQSRLHRLTTDPKLRPWFIAGGMLAIVVGLLPPSERTAPADED